MKKPFRGKIYVKGEHGNPDCQKIYNTNPPIPPKNFFQWPNGKEHFVQPMHCPPCPPCEPQLNSHIASALHVHDEPKSVQMAVRIGSCRMRRERTVHVFSNLINLVCPRRLNCVHRLQCHLVSIPFVEVLQTDHWFALLKLVSKSIINGSATLNSNVTDGYDGRDQRVLVVDEKGCSLDPFLIGDLSYIDSMTAFVPANVFKFADRTALDFQCAISICIFASGSCDGVTVSLCYC
ncbi:hypothetical protein D917_07703 [Trichinella nativa]|uniref:ZP domain-containing protein n=1 Tax=Trichinella nativa TaxID=6335 RepID=A0A1Y3EMS5_9BILA|nr:hypothetical protein D917_07703 [Trichinella nativa]